MTPWLVRAFSRRLLKHPPPPLRVALLLVSVLTYGASGFLFFELPDKPTLNWSDAFWYSIVTVSTVGYGDYSPASLGGRFLVAAPLMFFGIGLLGYVLSLAASALIEQKSKESHGMSQFGFSNHLVICNFPSLGVILQILDELNSDSSFKATRGIVLIDSKLTEIPQELVKRDVHFVRGDPSADDALERANVADAKHVIILSKSPGDPATDMVTVAIALAVTTISPNSDVVAQCVEPTHQALLRKARCAHVVCLGQFGAHFVASELLNPGAQDVVADLTSTLGGEQLYVSVYDGEPCSIEAVKKRCQTQRHLLIGLRRGPKLELNPPDEQQVNPKDHLITIGATRLNPL